VAWVALVPLLVALARPSPPASGGRRSRTWRPLALGLTAGGVYFAGTLYWVAGVMETYGGLHGAVALLVTVALVAYLALYPALFAVIIGGLAGRIGPRAVLLAPIVWVATEFGRGWVLGGFPWVVLGYSQVSVLPIAQLASLGGVYALSALVSGVSGALAFGVLARGRRAGWAAVAVAIVAVALATAWGGHRMATGDLTRQGTPISVGLIQGNIPQDQKWEPARASSILETYLALSRDAAGRGARFIVWPEAATPYPFEDDPAVGNAIRGLAVETRAAMLFGSDQVEPGKPPRYYNAAYVVDSGGMVVATYRKVHLVPFGEYVPFKHLLFFVSPLVESAGDFSAGDETVMLPVEGHLASTAICYEVVYPALIRQSVTTGSELLTTITNDAWYGRTSAPFQHFEQAALRAIESGRYLARAANTGVSGIVDPYGRVVARTGLFETTALVGEVRFLTVQTPYSRFGDLVAYVALGLSVSIAGWMAGTGRRRPRARAGA
jgi:apolipoprotein N-acyltransferase